MLRSLELKPVGGVLLKNQKGQIVFWLKGKDADNSPPFALCAFYPERADTPTMAEGLKQLFEVTLEMARTINLTIFDSTDVDRQIKRFIREAGGPAALTKRTEEITVLVRDLATKKRMKLTLSVKPAKTVPSTQNRESLLPTPDKAKNTTLFTPERARN